MSRSFPPHDTGCGKTLVAHRVQFFGSDRREGGGGTSVVSLAGQALPF